MAAVDIGAVADTEVQVEIEALAAASRTLLHSTSLRAVVEAQAVTACRQGYTAAGIVVGTAAREKAHMPGRRRKAEGLVAVAA